MLKLQHRGTEKTIWLVGPCVKIGSAKNDDMFIEGTGIEPHHCSLHISDQGIELEPVSGTAVYLNEKAVTGRTSVKEGDVLRVVSQEFSIIDPKSQRSSAQEVSHAGPASEQTVFRGVPAAPVAEQGTGWLLQALHASLKNKRYPLEGTMVIGRSADCELPFSYERLSRRHAELKLINNALVVQDLNSSNGTFVNGEKVEKATLHHGDTLAFDKLEFTVIAPEKNSAAKPAEQEGQTVMRPVQTRAKVEPAKAQVATASDKSKKNTNGIIVLAAAFIVLGLLAFVLLV